MDVSEHNPTLTGNTYKKDLLVTQSRVQIYPHGLQTLENFDFAPRNIPITVLPYLSRPSCIFPTVGDFWHSQKVIPYRHNDPVAVRVLHDNAYVLISEVETPEAAVDLIFDPLAPYSGEDTIRVYRYDGKENIPSIQKGGLINLPWRLIFFKEVLKENPEHPLEFQVPKHWLLFDEQTQTYALKLPSITAPISINQNIPFPNWGNLPLDCGLVTQLNPKFLDTTLLQ